MSRVVVLRTSVPVLQSCFMDHPTECMDDVGAESGALCHFFHCVSKLVGRGDLVGERTRFFTVSQLTKRLGDDCPPSAVEPWEQVFCEAVVCGLPVWCDACIAWLWGVQAVLHRHHHALTDPVCVVVE